MLLALVLICSIAVWLDLRTRRLPNWLTVGSLVIALTARALPGGPSVWPGLASAALALAFGFPFFMTGGLGGGDVKLMAGLAAFLEPQKLAVALLVMAFSGGAMALLTAARKGLLASTLANVHVLVLTMGRKSFQGWKQEPSDGRIVGRVSNPYAPAIVAGALAGWFF
jgi:prepilin peptidase CpaA